MVVRSIPQVAFEPRLVARLYRLRVHSQVRKFGDNAVLRRFFLLILVLLSSPSLCFALLLVILAV